MHKRIVKQRIIGVGIVLMSLASLVTAVDPASSTYAKPTAEHNLINNGAFERAGSGHMPIGWRVQTFRGHPAPTISVLPGTDGMTGNIVSIKFNPTAKAYFPHVRI